MSWFITMLMSGVLLSIGWRFGGAVYEYIKDFVHDYPDGIRKIKAYKHKRDKRDQRYITAARRRRES